MGDLLVIIPSRGRPGHIADLWAAWEATSAGVAQLVVCVDDDDESRYAYPAGPHYHVGPRAGFAPRLSSLATEVAPHWGAVASWTDKHRPRTPGWDRVLVEQLAELGTGFVYGDDLMHGPGLPTACAVTTDVVQALGYLTPPELPHLYVDNVWADWGQAIHRIRYLGDVVIEHMHPSAGKGEWDDLMWEANTPEAFACDEAAYHAYKADRFAGDVEKLEALR